jgi:hypothetical protein
VERRGACDLPAHMEAMPDGLPLWEKRESSRNVFCWAMQPPAIHTSIGDLAERHEN